MSFSSCEGSFGLLYLKKQSSCLILTLRFHLPLEYVHIRVQQRNGRKSLTTVQGLKKEYSKTKILKDLKKEFCCNGTVVEDPELGQVIQLQGDQRKNVSTFLVQAGILKKEQIKIHGF
ncbi:protein translation factor SUI1 homolog 1 isoform X1 [Dendrobium catenatum]|uniref:protein translation factor SUI1 homolog 1 isoform X1 n=1 Tax=Dendrobium catenatum TaxID=906689 RepID=UPI00109F6868|nr:protein translation factor SUI1 homolog 1 isoform X1 [Dendrobium catenatum]